MSFLHACSFTLELTGEIRASTLGALLRTLAPVFVPSELSYRLSDAGLVNAMAASDLWRGELRGSEFLTAYTPDASPISTPAGDTVALWFHAIGALRHRVPGTAGRAWYGRWQIASGGLHELVEVRLSTQRGQPRELEIVFPLIGYPLTSSRLAGDGLVAGDPAVAEQNRRDLLPVIAQLPAALGLRTSWRVSGEYEWDYPDDAKRIGELLAREDLAQLR